MHEEPTLIVAASQGSSKPFYNDANDNEANNADEFKHVGCMAVDRSSAHIACNHSYVAIAGKDGRIAVWNLYECHLKVC